MNLADMQRDFYAWLTDGALTVEPQVPEPARRGLAVYHNALRANLIDCLSDSYERTHAWLGDAAFDTAARGHIENHPSRSWTLGDYGAGFAETLAGLYPADPEVAELAWLDWTLRRAFDGPDSPELDTASFAEIDWEDALLRIAPTMSVRRLTTNAAAIWSALASGSEPPAPLRLDRPAAVVVWRQEFSPRFLTVSDSERHALGLAMAGLPFGDICSELRDDFPDDEAATVFVGAMLARWLAEGVIVGVETNRI
jgi:hypothetical protein